MFYYYKYCKLLNHICAHLTSLFNWNVKQLFVYMTAEYETPTNALNQVNHLCS